MAELDLSKLNLDGKKEEPAAEAPAAAPAAKAEDKAEDTAAAPAAPEAKEAKADSEVPPEDKPQDKSQDKPSAEAEPEAPSSSSGSGLIDNEYEVEVKLADQQADPSSPLYSVKSFQELGLSPELLKGIVMMRFVKPSKIQERALPLLLSNPPKNMIAQSQSGTGKTAAFALNMLSRVVPTLEVPQAICLCPSRELTRQNLDVVATMGKYIPGLKVELAVPGTLEGKAPVQAQIIVGTPGRIQDLIRRKRLDTSRVQCLVVDEADNMLDTGGMGPPTMRIRTAMPASTQMVLFSATFPDEVTEFAARFAPNSNEIRLKHTDLNVDAIKQVYMDCDSDDDKFNALKHLYGLLTIGSSIIFVARKDTAELLARRMNEFGHQVSLLHGGQDGAERDKRIDEFRSGATKVLISTNVLARGIDVPTVSMVVNYDLPVTGDGKPDPSTYLHRIGRTGRFGQIGVAVSFVHSPESLQVLQSIRDYFGPGMKLVNLPTDNWDAVEKFIKKNIRK